MNSVLNPEAPEFHPHITSVTKDGYTKMHITIRSSNSLPSGASRELFKTSTDFNVVATQLSINVVSQSNQILLHELPAVKLKPNDIDYNTEKLADANDVILDRVNINIDSVHGVNKPSDKFTQNASRPPQVSSWNKGAVVAKIKFGGASFLGAKNIPRPQLTFKDTIDNSDSLWVPKISDKPNNVKPLALNILYNEEGEAVGYEHPYKVELDLYHPPSQFIDPDSTPPAFPDTLENTKLTHVDTEEQLDALVEHLTHVNELAVDVEHHSYRTYQGITCLIQISTNEGGDFIVDTLAIREHIHKLNLIFTDPKKIKVLHGAESDVIWLQRDFGLYIVGLFDTHQAAKVLKLSGLSLKYLLLKYCDVNADKKYQLADWRMRPLPDELIEYARMDTHYLLFVWRQMKAELLESAAGQPHLLLSVFEMSRQICGATYNKVAYNESSHLPLYVRSNKSFNSQQMVAFKIIYKWRDMQARQLDESPTFLIPNHMLLSLAETLPRELQGVSACCCPMPPFVKQNLIAIHRMLLSCRELPMEPQLFQMPNSIRSMMNNNYAAHYNIHDLSQFPDHNEELPLNLDQYNHNPDEDTTYKPEIEAFMPAKENTATEIVSNLNAEAKLFIPPYDRYRKYRILAQMEEMKEYKEKEAKIAALGKGNELIKEEVLDKLQPGKSHDGGDGDKSGETSDAQNETDGDKKQRKRKMSAEKATFKIPTRAAPKAQVQTTKNANQPNTKVNSYQYKNANYKKFYYEVEKDQKKLKMKLIKHK